MNHSGMRVAVASVISIYRWNSRISPRISWESKISDCLHYVKQTMRRTPDWQIQTSWWLSGIFATGAVWYFLSIQSYMYSGVAALFALAFAVLAISLHRRNDSADEQNQPAPAFEITVCEEKITFTELVRSLEYDIVKVHAHTHMLGVMAEHRWMHHMYPDCEMKMQALSTLDRIQGVEGVTVKDPLHFDVMTIALPDGRTKKIYFDISSFFGGGGSLMDPESAVARKMIDLYGQVAA